jgi:hypothetical protein
MEVKLKYKIKQDSVANRQSITTKFIVYGIWDHQDQKLVSRYIRHAKNNYKKTETKYPRIFTQMNHAQSALITMTSEDPEAYLRYETVSITTNYEISTSLPAELRQKQLTKRHAISKLTAEEKAVLGIKD